MTPLHPLLLRQMRRLGIVETATPPDHRQWNDLLTRVSTAYREADDERYLLERSMQISSSELLELNERLSLSEARIAADRDLLQAVFTSIGDSLLVFDATGRCVMMNPAAQALLDRRPEEISDWTALEAISGITLQAGSRQFERNDDAIFRRRDGTAIPVSYVLDPIERDDCVHGVVLVFRDISERKRAEAMLVREHQQILGIIDNAPVPMAMLDREMRYLAHSKQWLAEYHLPPESLVGKSHFDVFPETDARWRAFLARTMQGEIMSCPEDSFILPNGKRIILRWAFHPWFTPEGTVGGIILVTTRIDDLVEAREAALEAARIKAEFLANMSHEIRTPMNGVLGMTDLLLETPLASIQREFTETIRLSADSLLTIINDILDFSKIEAGKMQLESIEFDLHDTIYDAIDLVAERAQRKGIEIQALVAPEVPLRVLGDPTRIRQVLLNLVSNAVKFTDRGQISVVVSGKPGDSGAVVTTFQIIDSGIGISAEAQGRLFQAFSQADGSTTRKYGGTGLGLAICTQLVALMGGSIDVESQPGAGSTFRFQLALAVPEGAPIFDPLHGVPALRGRVLVVDHGRLSGQAIRGLLEHRVAVPVALESDPAREDSILNRAASDPNAYRIVFLDLERDGKISAGTVDRIVQLPRQSREKIVLLAAAPNYSEASELATREGLHLIVKPIRPRKLRAILTAIGTRGNDAKDTALSHAEALPSPCGAADHPIVALVAEDNPVNSMVVTRMLEKLGVKSRVVANGEQAVAAYQSEDFDLVFMDCQMPEVDGFEATRRIRALEVTNHRRVPILALTAHAQLEDRDRCLSAGMDDYLAKPISMQDLSLALDRWLGALRPCPLPTPPRVSDGRPSR